MDKPQVDMKNTIDALCWLDTSRSNHDRIVMQLANGSKLSGTLVRPRHVSDDHWQFLIARLADGPIAFVPVVQEGDMVGALFLPATMVYVKGDLE